MKQRDLIEDNWKIDTKHSLEHKLDEKISILKYKSLMRVNPPEMKRQN